MLLIPSTLQNTSLSPSAKRCVMALKNRLSDDYVGVDGINMTGGSDDNFFAILSSSGLLLVGFPDAAFVSGIPNAEILLEQQYKMVVSAFFNRLHTHSALKSDDGKLLFPVSIVYLFPDTLFESLSEKAKNSEVIKHHCLFAEWTDKIKPTSIAEQEVSSILSNPNESYDGQLPISEKLRDIILNRIAPWATIPKLTQIDIIRAQIRQKEAKISKTAKVTKDDSMVDVLRLDKKQLDEVNAIKHGHQLILACAGSGKSVLLIAKCFKLASMDKSRKFIILCYNKNLRDYYRWQINEAGFAERNVECYSFHQLCRFLLKENHIPLPVTKDEDAFFQQSAFLVKKGIQEGKIPQRYYGIFIDEVQVLDPEWYRICCMLLEDPDGDNHILAICGDQTQNLRKSVKHGSAPWQGEGLPVFRGRTIHIETNYRNSVQINRFINVYAGLVRGYLPQGESLSTEIYLRGTAYRNGPEPSVFYFDNSVEEEAKQVMQAVLFMHAVQKIPYSEIAILLYNQAAAKGSWIKYPLRAKIKSQLLTYHPEIPYVELVWSETVTSYETRDGVALLTYVGSLGIDFRGVIVCGIPLIGRRLGVSNDTKETIEKKKPDEQVEYRNSFDALYVACSRAKESLAVVLPRPDSSLCSTYSRILQCSIDEYNRGEDEVIVHD